MADEPVSEAAPSGRRFGAGAWLALCVALTAVAAGGLVLWLATAPGPVAVARLAVPLPPPEAPPAEPPVPAKPTVEKPAAEKPAAEKAPSETPPPAAPAPAAQPPVAAAPSPPPPPPPPPAAQRAGMALLPAPDPDLVERRGELVLPTIGRDGRQPWQVYARPFDRADRRPRIAVVVSGLGRMQNEAKAAIEDLPGAVTLAFLPSAPRLQEWVDQARGAGHEVLFGLPMEPFDYPRQDPGPNTLLTSLDARQNVERLDWTLTRASGYVGLVGFMGTRFVTSANDLKPVLEVLKNRGLLYLDNGASSQSTAPGLAAQLGMPRAVNDRFIDSDPSRPGIEKRLADLEDLARRNGSAVGIGVAYPLTLERLADWAKGLDDKGFALAPVSAVAALQSDRGREAKP